MHYSIRFLNIFCIFIQICNKTIDYLFNQEYNYEEIKKQIIRTAKGEI